MANMRVDVTGAGPVVAAEDLGRLLGLRPAEVPRLMREGIVAVRYERRVDEDAGRFRLSFRDGGPQVLLTCTNDCTVVSTVRISGVEPSSTDRPAG